VLQERLRALPVAGPGLSGALSAAEVGSWLTAAAGQSVGILTHVAYALFVALFLALEPGTYRRGVLALAPAARRAAAERILDDAGGRLRWWLLGRCFTMLLVGSLVTVGLWAMGIPLALLFGALAGIFNFIPYVGPLVAALPAVLVALVESPKQALWVAALFVAIQSFEGWVLTPLVDRRSVSLRPALTLAAQMSMGVLAGAAGVALASPLLVCVLVLVGDRRGGAGPAERGRGGPASTLLSG
jgi:predicted PurR-regulated permease PerM